MIQAKAVSRRFEAKELVFTECFHEADRTLLCFKKTDEIMTLDPSLNSFADPYWGRHGELNNKKGATATVEHSL